MRRSFSLQRPDHFVLLEADPELREILVAEIASAAKVNVRGAGPEDLDGRVSLAGAMPVALYSHFKVSRSDRSADGCAGASLGVGGGVDEGANTPPADALVAIVSRWPEFLRWARTMLVAAGLDADALSFRDARERGWEKGLRSATFVITDSLMAPRIPPGCEIKIFRVLAQSSIKEIRDYAERFF